MALPKALRNEGLPRFPPHFAHPLLPILRIVTFQDPFDRIPLPRQLLITGHSMYKTVASPTQPRHTIEPPLLVPASLQNLGVHTTWYQVMIRQWDPVSFAYLTVAGLRAEPSGWGRSGTGDVITKNGIDKT